MGNRFFKTASMIIAAFLMTAAAVSFQSVKAQAAGGEMAVTVIDLGTDSYGDAVMLSSGGKNLLMDTGDKDKNRSIFRFLDSNGYKTFDLYISHWHDDHDYYAAEIIQKYNVRTVYLPDTGYMKRGSGSYMDFHRNLMNQTIKAAKDRGCKIVWLKKGSTFSIGSASARVLWGCGYTAGPYDLHYINNNSLLTKFTCGGLSYLTAGDLEANCEKQVLGAGINVDSDLYKMSHHGGNNANSSSFLRAVNPQYAFFNYCGDSPSRYMSSDWIRDSAGRMQNIANTYSARYNGNVKFTFKSGRIYVSCPRNSMTIHERLVDKKTGEVKVKTLSLNKAAPINVRSDMFTETNCMQFQANSNGSYFSNTWKNGAFRNGTAYAGDTFVRNGGKWYYVNRKGEKVYGWFNKFGNRYYLDKSKGGARATGWKTIGGKKYYFQSNGAMTKDKLLKVGGYYYYFKSDGTCQTGWKTVGNNKYYFLSSGRAATGWRTISGTKYYFKSNASMAKNQLLKVSGYYYYFKSNGAYQTGWKTIGNNKYYFLSNGRAATGWRTISGTKYYFKSNASMVKNQLLKVSGYYYYFKSNGAYQIGWKTIGNNKYYFLSNGRAATGWKLIDGSTYLFADDGCAVKGTARKDGALYHFDSDYHLVCGTHRMDEDTASVMLLDDYMDEYGNILKEWYLSGDPMYRTDDDGRILTGWYRIKTEEGGKVLALKTDMKVEKNGHCEEEGWDDFGGDICHADDEGIVSTGETGIDGEIYLFDEDGRLIVEAEETEEELAEEDGDVSEPKEMPEEGYTDENASAEEPEDDTEAVEETANTEISEELQEEQEEEQEEEPDGGNEPEEEVIPEEDLSEEEEMSEDQPLSDEVVSENLNTDSETD